MAFSFTAPAMATAYVEPISEASGQEISTIDTEMTQFYWRTYNGKLQYRVWSITYGRWITDWTDL